jgi:hypothetical protein
VSAREDDAEARGSLRRLLVAGRDEALKVAVIDDRDPIRQTLQLVEIV